MLGAAEEGLKGWSSIAVSVAWSHWLPSPGPALAVVGIRRHLTNPWNAPPGTLLKDEFVIGRVLGAGGFGITYLGWQLSLDRKVAIKEFFPRGLVSRAPASPDVTVFTGDAQQHFEAGLREFLDEGRKLARFDSHPGVVRVYSSFAANGTAYLVMEYLEGQDFKQFLTAQPGGRVGFDIAHQVLTPVLDALRALHEQNIFHRDLSPDNIYITSQGPVKLIDFGAAREVVGDQSQSISVVLKAGYAPTEQYSSRGKQGAWTDIYAMAATYYRALLGEPPPPSLDLMQGDASLREFDECGPLESHQKEALDKAISLRRDDRYQNVADFQHALRLGGATDVTIQPPSVPTPLMGATPEPPSAPTPAPTSQRKRGPNWVAIAAGVVLFLGTGAIVNTMLSEEKQQPPPPPPTPGPDVAGGPTPPPDQPGASDPTPAPEPEPDPQPLQPPPPKPTGPGSIALAVSPGDARVRVLDAAGREQRLSRQGGGWAASLPSGAYRVVAERCGRKTASRPFELAPGEAKHLNVSLNTDPMADIPGKLVFRFSSAPGGTPSFRFSEKKNSYGWRSQNGGREWARTFSPSCDPIPWRLSAAGVQRSGTTRVNPGKTTVVNVQL